MSCDSEPRDEVGDTPFSRAPASLISIVMPFRDAETTIGIAVHSIVLQTYRDWELLLCDDGSTDGSADIARSFNDERLVVWSDGERKTLAPRLNECIDRARGKYLARMDADDVAYPDRFEKQLRFLESHPEVDLVGGRAVVFGGNGALIGKRIGPQTHQEIVRKLRFGSSPLMHPTFFGRVSWFRRFRYAGGAVRCEDHDILLRAAATSVYANLPDILLGYREEKLDLTRIDASRRNWLRRRLEAARTVPDFVEVGLLACTTVAKMSLDRIAVWSGLNHRLLRHRALPVQPSEREEWEEVWRKVNNSARLIAAEKATRNDGLPPSQHGSEDCVR